MKRLWNVIAVVAIANIAAFGGFLAWLTATGRLDRERIERVKEVFRETIAQETQRLAQEQADADAKSADAALAEKMARPPVPAEAMIQRAEAAREEGLQQVLRLRREVDDLKRTLDRERGLLDNDVAAFHAMKADFEASRKRMAETEGTEQFRKALKTLESQKPADAVKILLALQNSNPGTGAAGDEEQVIAYLSSMEDRTRAKVMAEFVKVDDRLAAGLLDRLRTKGLIAPSEAKRLAGPASASASNPAPPTGSPAAAAAAQAGAPPGSAAGIK